jgi:hypothetical protein
MHPVVDDQLIDHKGPLAQLAQVSAKFAASIDMHQEIRNRDIHNHL